MQLMIAEVYDALIEAGASEEKARKASISIASYNDRISNVEHKLDNLERKIDHVLTEVRVFGGVIITLIMSTLWRVWK